MWGTRKTEMVAPERALPGRSATMAVSGPHLVLGTSLYPPYPEGSETAVFGMGCFWGAERIFWRLPGVVTTAVGYAGGYTRNPTYEEVCSQRTGHAEVVLVVFDPLVVSYDELLKRFFEEHDPTQAMRQGNDVGTQYRSMILWSTEEQQRSAHETAKHYSEDLKVSGISEVVTEVKELGEFYYAEGYHQQYLARNPSGYCGLQGTGVTCQIPRA